MSIKTRLNKLESAAQALPEIWLLIITREGDSDEVIERYRAKAVAEWTRANPDKALPREFNWIEVVLVSPPPQPLH